jgi:hypothetical protein
VVTTGLEPFCFRAQSSPGGFSIDCIQIAEGRHQPRDVFVVARVHDIQVECRYGRTVEHRADAADDDEVDLVAPKRLQQLEEISFGHEAL